MSYLPSLLQTCCSFTNHAHTYTHKHTKVVFLGVRMQMGLAGSFWGCGWGLWQALKGVDPAGGSAAWSGGCCCPNPGGGTGFAGGNSTAGCGRSPTAGYRWRSCRSRGCSSCWGWPAGRRASQRHSQSLQGKREERFMKHTRRRQQLNQSVFPLKVHVLVWNTLEYCQPAGQLLIRFGCLHVAVTCKATPSERQY